ncbi:condensation domain-containing protein [Gordonia polyisoprenivorans]|uniref:condensation domain-containing protein n=1 Tax=Gordonia polyisoprenivorans TaxID=84595 RepID=UPI0023002021|nr:condensation domain-containing protein [Gordonia polyisoprenivorans]WCB38120.1 condensation domain-containing protein [Gordonia polyisoprenivorans]
MEYTELADYPVPAGRITEWIPTVEPDRWQSDDRPLSPNHTAHLYNSESAPDSGDLGLGSWIGTAFRLPGDFDHSVFAAVLRAWIVRHDAFRTTVTRRGDTHARVVAVAESVTISARVQQAPPPGVGVDRHLERFFAREVSAVRWPHVVAVTIEPDSPIEAAKGVTVIVAADHSVMDAYTQLLLIAEFREIHRALVEGRAPALPSCGSYVDHCAREFQAAETMTADHPAVQAWRCFLTTDDGRLQMPRLPLPTQPTGAVADGAGWQSSISRWLLTAQETNGFAAACKNHGASMSGGAFTALAVAIQRLTGDSSFRFVMPMHTRTDPQSLAAAGWYVGLVPVDLSLEGAETFSAALTSVSSGVRRHAALAHAPHPRIASLLGITEAPRFAVSYVDGRHVPGADSWGDRDRALRSRIHNLDEVYLWINRTHEGINISLRFPNNEIATTSIHALLAEFRAVLLEVADRGELALDAGAPTERTVSTTRSAERR